VLKNYPEVAPIDEVPGRCQGGAFLTGGNMASIGQTLFRFAGALLLGASATAIDHPVALFAPTVPVQTVPVVVASRDIPEASIIDRTDVVVAQWPVGTVPDGAYISVDSVDHRMSRVSIFKGEAIVPGRVTVDTGPGLEIKLTPGKRAFGIRVAGVSGVAGVPKANSRVDVILVSGHDEKDKVARLFMQDMRVLAFSPVFQHPDDVAPATGYVATIEVTPEEAERLALAMTQGMVVLRLRANGEADSLGIADVSQCDRPPTGALTRDVLLRNCSPRSDTATVRIFRSPK